MKKNSEGPVPEYPEEKLFWELQKTSIKVFVVESIFAKV